MKSKASKTNVTGRDKSFVKPKFQTILLLQGGKKRFIREPINEG